MKKESFKLGRICKAVLKSNHELRDKSYIKNVLIGRTFLKVTTELLKQCVHIDIEDYLYLHSFNEKQLENRVNSLDFYRGMIK